MYEYEPNLMNQTQRYILYKSAIALNILHSHNKPITN
jgi:hypothetical protein